MNRSSKPPNHYLWIMQVTYDLLTWWPLSKEYHTLSVAGVQAEVICSKLPISQSAETSHKPVTFHSAIVRAVRQSLLWFWPLWTAVRSYPTWNIVTTYRWAHSPTIEPVRIKCIHVCWTTMKAVFSGAALLKWLARAFGHCSECVRNVLINHRPSSNPLLQPQTRRWETCDLSPACVTWTRI